MIKAISLLLLFNLFSLYSLAQYDEEPASRIRIAASGGYAYRIGKKPAGQYFKDISHGPVFTSDLTYSWNSRAGVGLKYSLFSTASSDYSNIISNIKINFIGALYKVRSYSANNKLELSSGVGLGYMGYRDDGWINSEKGTIKGSSLGAIIEGGLDGGGNEYHIVWWLFITSYA